MKISATISQIGLAVLSGCGLAQPKSTFRIISTDRPVKSAILQLCQKTFPLVVVDGHWEASVRVPDCHGGVTAMMTDGSRVFCPIGYVTTGDGSTWLFTIKRYECRSDLTFPDMDRRNSS
jgi:hypothetical protein